MRLAAATAALALLVGACTVQTEGAPCGSDANCPSGQGCGADGTCSAAALSCPGHTADGECLPGSSCDAQGEVVVCTRTSSACSSRTATPCPAHQACEVSAAGPACACQATRCSAAVASYCDPGEAVVTCAQDTGTDAGCWYGSAPVACAPAQTCVESGGSAACTCPGPGDAVGQGCSTQDAGACSGTRWLRCLPAATGSPCLVWQLGADCAPAGQVCTASGCQCPAPGSEVGQGCAAEGAGSCSGTQLLRCGPVVTGSACLAWQPASDCAAQGLVCAPSGCLCPAPSGGILFADAASGSSPSASPPPSGAPAPARCRFSTLGDALAAAATGGASTVRASGWSASLPDGVMTFAEAGPLSVPAGVTLTTDEDPPVALHYAVSAPATPGATAFVTLAPGSTLSGLVVRNAGSTSTGIASACAGGSGTVRIRAVSVVGSSGEVLPTRFLHGVLHSGTCSLELLDSVIAGASDAGLVVENVAADATVTLLRNTITGNQATSEFLISGEVRRGGGVLFSGALPTGASLVFQGNRVYANQRDQILAYTSGPLSLAGGLAPSACGTTSNFIGCYADGTGGVGISTVATGLDVSFNQWQVIPIVEGRDYVGTLVGTNLTCARLPFTCPP
jgi:hypothetical protein